MRVFYELNEFDIEGPNAVTLGCFDGVHIGHRAIISRLLEHREKTGIPAGLITFDPLPDLALNRDSACRLITTTSEKIEILEDLGLDWALVISFSRDFMRITAEEFVRDILAGLLHTQHAVVGHDVGFGFKRQGNEAFLRDAAARYGFGLEVLSAVKSGRGTVSSTAIRKKIESAELDDARRMLGRPFSFRGEVMHDRHLGRTIGIPTANISVHPHKIIVPDGIYAVRATVNDSTEPAVMSIGVRPTVSADGPRSIEVHILDFEGDIYGEVLTVEPVKFLRGEQKYESFDALLTQIHLDIAAARRALA